MEALMIFTGEITKLLLAVLVGGLIGAEREFRHRAAGFRTIIFICLGSTLFTMFSLELGGEASPVRIAAHMVTGVGFLCAGVIMEEKERIVGLTTAATIWFTAAMGMGIGGGQYAVVAASMVGAMVILWVFPRFEKWIYNVRERRTYKIVSEINPDKLQDLETIFRECGLIVKGHKLNKKNGEVICTIDAYGAPEHHERVMEKLITKNEVKEFKY
jgi:putative Mg2+ transporter-C (MgtC) family protein